MTKEKYNGWTNRETWLVNLHFSEVLDMHIQELKYEREKNNEELSQYEISQYLESLFDAIMESELNTLSSFISDYIDFSLIDWNDLAEQYMD